MSGTEPIEKTLSLSPIWHCSGVKHDLKPAKVHSHQIVEVIQHHHPVSQKHTLVELIMATHRTDVWMEVNKTHLKCNILNIGIISN